jgi:hypothetical protein
MSTSSQQTSLVSESAFVYLLGAALHLAQSADSSSSSADAYKRQQHEAAVVARLDGMGYDVGYRYVERAVANQTFLGSEPLDIVKYICKEFWEDVFRKKIDKLQTNHKGVFVLSDFRFRWLERYSSDDAQSKQAAARLLHFPCGLLRGALANLGIAAIVTADFAQLPGVQFNIRALVAAK